jgi:hypothetical protein
MLESSIISSNLSLKTSISCYVLVIPVHEGLGGNKKETIRKGKKKNENKEM